MKMRELSKIIFHCADTRVDQDFSVEDIARWHKARGWSNIGYHYYIKLDGSIHEGRHISKVGSHCRGENTNSIGVCFEGGKKADGTKWDKPTNKQIHSGRVTIEWLRGMYGDLSVHGHYEFSSKNCPNFDVCIL